MYVKTSSNGDDKVAEQSAMVMLADLQEKHANSAKAKATKKDLQLKRPAFKAAPIHDNTQPDPGEPNLAARVARILSQADPNLTSLETLESIRSGLSNNEIHQIWGQRRTAALHGDVAAKRYDDDVGRHEQDRMALAWFIERKAGFPAFAELIMTTINAKIVDKREK